MLANSSTLLSPVGAPPYKKLKKMRYRVKKVRNTPSNKDTLAVKLSKIFWRSGKSKSAFYTLLPLVIDGMVRL